jgi:hypothetical protein
MYRSIVTRGAFQDARDTKPREQLNRLYGKPETRILGESKGVRLAGTTGLEPATSDVTGRRSNQLNYVPARRQTITD